MKNRLNESQGVVENGMVEFAADSQQDIMMME